MPDIPQWLAKKLAPLIRMLSSDKDGEIAAAGRAIMRTLDSGGLDIHALADHVERGHGDDGKFGEEDMKAAYDAGRADGVMQNEAKHFNGGAGGVFQNINGLPPWEEIAAFCQREKARLRPNQQEFVDDMAARTVYREPTEKQGKWLLYIFKKLGGQIT